MTIVYVDSNAVGLNDGTSWTDAYANVNYCLANHTFTEDSKVLVSSTHSASGGDFVYPAFNVDVISVNSSTDAYERGAEELSTESFKPAPGYIGTLSGMNITSVGNKTAIKGLSALCILNDCEITNVATSELYEVFSLNIDGARGIVNNCIINYTSNPKDWVIRVSYGAYLEMNNCEFLSAGTVNNLVSIAGNGGGNIILNNCDFSTISATNIVEAMTIGDDNVVIAFNKCKLPTATTYETGSALPKVTINFNGCLHNYFSYEQNTYSSGINKQDIVIYPTTTVDLSVNHSVSMEGTNNSIGNPLRHKLAEIPAQDLTSGATLTVHTVTDGITLTDSEFWIEAEYPDNTSQALGVIVSTRNSDILAAGTALTTDLVTVWNGTGGFTEVKQEVEVTIPTLSNVTDGLVAIYCNLATVQTVFVSPVVD